MKSTPNRLLQILAVLLGLASLAATVWLFVPLFSPSPVPDERWSTLPDYDYTPWHALPVQSGRIMPFDSFARDAVRQITGRAKFEGHDPVAIVLAWLLTEGRGAGGDYTDWEQYPLILCDHHGLRQAIYGHLGQITDEQSRGKRITPADLRVSPGFDALLSDVSKARQESGAKAHQRLSAEHLKAEEVGRRLVLFDQLCGKATTRLHANALCAEQFLDLKEMAVVEDRTPEQALLEHEKKLKKHPDPLHLVGLHPVEGSPWFSLGELRAARESEVKWREFVQERLREMPWSTLRTNPSPAARPTADVDSALTNFDRLRDAYRRGHSDQFSEATATFRQTLCDATDWTTIKRLSLDSGLYSSGGKDADARARGVPADWSRIRDRFFSDFSLDAARYPGVGTIDLELCYNRLQPFLWAWITMLLAVVVLFFSLMLQSSVAYGLGCALYAASMLIQIVGFAARIAISGWAPVTNMYESVIFVAFIAGLLALILELIYRRTVIALAGAAVSTLGLILADQLPLALDPKISPVVPVLRTNYWLTIHVLTIVCGYGAGTLAWGLGNVSLAMLAFGRGSPDTLKMLGKFTYRAMQLTVVLLAAGTFLGAWWAAEAWGRFWGWDPKETGAFIALLCYVIPLHARYLGWVREFGLAVSAVLCYAAILLSWFVVNFVLAAGLHSYGFGGGGGEWVLWAGLVNLEWVVIAGLLYARKQRVAATVAT